LIRLKGKRLCFFVLISLLHIHQTKSQVESYNEKDYDKVLTAAFGKASAAMREATCEIVSKAFPNTPSGYNYNQDMLLICTFPFHTIHKLKRQKKKMIMMVDGGTICAVEKNLSQNFHDITSDGDRPVMTGTEALKYHYSYTFFIRNGTTIMILLMMIQLMERIYWIQMKTVLRRRFQYVSTPSSKRIQWVPVWHVVILLAKIYFVSFISFCFVLFCFISGSQNDKTHQ